MAPDSSLRSQVEHDIAVHEYRYLAIPGSSLKHVDKRLLQTLLVGTETFLENVPDGLRVPGLPQDALSRIGLPGDLATAGYLDRAALQHPYRSFWLTYRNYTARRSKLGVYAEVVCRKCGERIAE